MSRRYGKCVECGGLYGHHMTGCPETPDAPYEEEIENDDNLDDADASEMENDDE